MSSSWLSQKERLVKKETGQVDRQDNQDQCGEV